MVKGTGAEISAKASQIVSKPRKGVNRAAGHGCDGVTTLELLTMKPFIWYHTT